MNNKNNNNSIFPTYTINGTSNARMCGIFKHIYSQQPIDGFSCSQMHITSEGTFEIDYFIPLITKAEADDFMNKPMRFFMKNLPNGTICISVRGAVSGDYIINPTWYRDNRIQRMKEKRECAMFLVDTADDQILGIRFCVLEDTLCETVGDALQTMQQYGYNSTDVATGFYKYIMPYSSSIYIGREMSSTHIRNLYTVKP